MSFIIPNAAINQHIAILGKTGAGKTWAAKTIVEHLLNQKRQACIIDPTGAWFGLRLSADGKRPGFNIVLLGGAHADIPLVERSGAAVARLVTEQGASVVIDTSGMTVGEYTRWFIDFAGTLYTTLRGPLHLVIDEAHYFMPQGRVPDPDAGRMLHAGNRLMSGGRSRGIRGVLITQRPAKLHKDALTCADTLIAMRVIAPQDRGAVKDWIDGAGDAVQGKEVLDSLAQLKRGEGWVWYPEGGHLERVSFPRIQTYDSSAAPTHGDRDGPKIAEIDLGEVRTALAEAVKEAEANDPKLLRKRIADLEKQLREKPGQAPAPPPEIREIHVLKNGQLDKALALTGKLDEIASSLKEAMGRVTRPAASAGAACFTGASCSGSPAGEPDDGRPIHVLVAAAYPRRPGLARKRARSACRQDASGLAERSESHEQRLLQQSRRPAHGWPHHLPTAVDGAAHRGRSNRFEPKRLADDERRAARATLPAAAAVASRDTAPRRRRVSRSDREAGPCRSDRPECDEQRLLEQPRPAALAGPDRLPRSRPGRCQAGSLSGVIMSKADYVRSQKQTRQHHCHWPGCDQQVPPAMWGCKRHWFMLPKSLRDRIWATYVPGQEVTMTPSREYLDAAGEVQDWIEANYPRLF